MRGLKGRLREPQGHNHWNCDFVDGEGAGGVRYVTNQRGYWYKVREGNKFDSARVYEV